MEITKDSENNPNTPNLHNNHNLHRNKEEFIGIEETLNLVKLFKTMKQRTVNCTKKLEKIEIIFEYLDQF